MSNLTTMWPPLSLPTKDFNSQLNTTQVSPESLVDFKTIFLVIIILLNILGNTAVIATVARDRELRSSPRNIALSSLGLSDILMAFVIAFKIWILHEQTVNTTCEVFTTLFSVFIYASILHLFTLSVDSYIAVFYPLKYRTIITVKRLGIVLAIIWVLPAMTMTLLPLFLNEENQFHLQSIFPYCVGPKDIAVNQSYKTFTYAVVCLLFILPMLCMMIVYLKIAKVSWYQSNRVGPTDRRGALHAGRSRNREMKWARTIGIVIGTFTVCYLPIIVLLLYQASHGTKSSLSTAIQFMAFTNTAINPIVYSLRSREYRKALLKLLKTDTIRSSVVNALPGVSSPSTTSSTQPKSRRRKSSLWIENSDLVTTSNSFTVFTPLHRTTTLENILHDLIKSAYYKEDTEESNHNHEASYIVKNNEIDSLPNPRVFPPERLDLSRYTLEPNVRII